jgi:Ca-activated chloride channel family protein
MEEKMKKINLNFSFLTFVFVIVYSALLPAQSMEGEYIDKTLSPYFFVKSDDPSVDQLPLKGTSAEVNIAGVIADVKVTQIYKNEGKNPLEAIYLFPASTRAAVYSMRMTIGERTIVAKIEKREEAREQYEKAKAEGKSASLLEQQRPNVFQMNVANIMPGDEIKVELSYTELLIPTDKIYEFVYPTVVGPRYSNQPEATAPPSENWVQNPYLLEGEAPTYTFDIKTTISAGMPIQEISCSSHNVTINYPSKSMAVVKLDPNENFAGNKDFILKYRLAGEKIEEGLLLYQGKEENFFLLMMQPPARIQEQNIPPREYIFIVDVSGSMHGFPLDISKRLLKDLINSLRSHDTFNLLFFAGGSSVMSESSIPATSENINRAIKMLESQRGGGGTELLPALQRALSMPKNEGTSRTIIIATDGYVSVEKEAFDLIRNKLGEANMFAFGIGSSVNRFLIEGMARAGMGESFIVTKQAEAEVQANKFKKYILSPVLTQIKTDFKEFDVYDVEPPAIPDVLAERPIILFGKWHKQPEGTITVSGYTGNQKKYHSTVNVSNVTPLESNAALKYLWARHRISILGDYNKLESDNQRITEITNLGLKYNLLTDYTSFVAIDSEVRNKEGQVTTVKQPLPLPEGVSNLAVGKMKGTVGGRGMFGQTLSVMSKEQPALAPTPAETKDIDEIAVSKLEGDIDKKKIRLKIKNCEVNIETLKAKIQSIIEKHLDKIESCIKQEKNASLLQKEISFNIFITPEGKVKKLSISKNDFNNKKIEDCMISTIKEIQFGELNGKKDIIVTLTLQYTM